MKIRKFAPILVILAVALVLRLIWDPHRIIWTYDQARDSFFMRDMIKNKDLILLGPQAEEFGLFHGPLYYYLFAPFYALTRGEPWLPLIVMTIINLLSAIPLALLSVRITKNKLAGILTFAVFSLSYAFIEYSRWLSNFSIAIPFIAWSYYLFYEILEGRKKKLSFFLLGLFLGLATQGEIFFLSLIAVIFLSIVSRKVKIKNLVEYVLGVGLGMLPILLAQIKFKFLGVRVLSEILARGYQSFTSTPFDFLRGYVDHLGVTFFQTIGAHSFSMGLLLTVFVFIWVGRKVNRNWLFAIILSHALLFTFDYVNAVFLDLGLALLLIVLVGVGFYFLYRSNRPLFVGAGILFLIFQAGLYKSYLVGKEPFGEYNFIQETSVLSDRDELISKMYEESGGKQFSFTAIGTPFGVRTVWASAFELYARSYNLPLPKWFEYYAEGYPGDEILVPTKTPGETHILILEPNIENLLPKPIIDRELGNQDNNTKKVKEFEMYGAVVQVRKPI